MKVNTIHSEVLHLIPELINVEVTLMAGKSTYEINDSSLEASKVMGIYMRGPAAGRKTKSNAAFPAANVFQCGFLQILDGNKQIINSLPLEMLQTANGEYVKVNFTNGIGMNNCKVVFSDPATPQNNTGLEIIFVIERNC